MKLTNRMSPWLMVALCVGGIAGNGRAANRVELFTRDASYEEYLHVRSNPDEEKITPIRVVRWMMGMRGQAVMPTTSTEFQPVVYASEHNVRAIAAIAYKFF